jgi:hypothetical protein
MFDKTKFVDKSMTLTFDELELATYALVPDEFNAIPNGASPTIILSTVESARAGEIVVVKNAKVEVSNTDNSFFNKFSLIFLPS